MKVSILKRIINYNEVTTLFQPIFDCRSETVQLQSFECLSRGPQNTNLERADILFEYARNKRAESILDNLCIATALTTAAQLPGAPRLSLNVHASTLGRDLHFPYFLQETAEANSYPLSQLTIEVSEHRPIWNSNIFSRVLDHLRELKVGIALDDFGTGFSNFELAIHCQPDLLKIDRSLIKSCHLDYYRQAIITSILEFAQQVGTNVIVEGIDNDEDLKMVKKLGIRLVQGFLFSKPISVPEILTSDFYTNGVLFMDESNQALSTFIG